MHIVTLIVAIVVVITGVYFSQRNSETTESITQETHEVLSEEAEFKTPTSSPTDKPEPTTVPTSPPPASSSNILDFKYPNSQIISSSSNSLSLESNDNSDSITEWYKDKIHSLGMNVKTFVTTKANDKILNKLVGSDENKEISVEISKESMASSVIISVTIIEK